jgi:hypothetical protein
MNGTDEALARHRQVRMGRRADEHGVGSSRRHQLRNAGEYGGAQALAGQPLVGAALGIREADELGPGIDLEQMAVDHAHAAGADDRAAERGRVSQATPPGQTG